VVFYLAFSTYRPRWRFAGLVAGLVCGGVIGFSRLAVRAHSLSEVLAGFALGLVICLIFAALDPAPRIGWLRLSILLGALAMLMLTVTGTQAPGQDILTRIALRLSGHAFPYMRGVWSSSACWL
jgi:membrane-associated PAP2 superfamily phosphatase